MRYGKYKCSSRNCPEGRPILIVTKENATQIIRPHPKDGTALYLCKTCRGIYDKWLQDKKNKKPLGNYRPYGLVEGPEDPQPEEDTFETARGNDEFVILNRKGKTTIKSWEGEG
jgi:hypothetical protein